MVNKLTKQGFSIFLQQQFFASLSVFCLVEDNWENWFLIIRISDIKENFFTYLLQNESTWPFAFTGERCFASLTITWREPFVLCKFALFAGFWFECKKLDLKLNFLDMIPWDDVEFPESRGMNFKPTITSPRYVATSSKGSD